MLFQKITSELTTKSYEEQALAIKKHIMTYWDLTKKQNELFPGNNIVISQLKKSLSDTHLLRMQMNCSFSLSYASCVQHL